MTTGQEYEARGLVTRRQFGVLLGAGVAMMLPQVANAVAVTESDVTITTPDGTADCYFVHPASGHGAGRSRVAGHLRAAAGIPADGQAARRVGLLGAGRESVLPGEEGADRAERRAPRRFADVLPLAQALNETTHMTDAKAFIAWLDQQAVGREEQEDRHAGLLHGRPDGVPHGGRGAGSRRRGRLVPWRRTRDRPAEQPAPAGLEDQGAVPDRDRRRTTISARRTRRTCSRRRSRKRNCPPRSRSTAAPRTAGARRIRASTTSRRPKRPGRVCWRCTARHSPRSQGTLRQGGPYAERPDGPPPHFFPSSASSSPIIRSITLSPPCQNFGSRASSPNGLSSSE